MLKQNIFSYLIFSVFSTYVSAADSISYSGRLVNNGAPISGPVSLKAELAYTNATTTILCSENLNNVSLTKGVFHVKLNFNCGATPLTQILAQTPSGQSVTIRITDVTNSKVYPFQPLQAVAFSNVADQLPKMNANTGDVLKWNGSKWAPGIFTSSAVGTVTNVTATAPLAIVNATTTPEISISQATTFASGYVTATDWSAFNSKQNSITAGTSSQYFRGDKTWQTLDTGAVAEHASHLYFTNARALGISLTGFTPANAVISQADNMVQAVSKAQGQIDSLTDQDSHFLVKNNTDNLSGEIALTNTLTADLTGDILVNGVPLTVNSAVNQSYVDTASDLKANKSGDTITGALSLNNELKIKGGSNYVTVKANNATATYNFILPINKGTSNYVLQTDGNGNLSWGNPNSTVAGASTVSSSGIQDGTIEDVDFNAAAGIQQSKIHNLTNDLSGKVSTTLAEGKILIGNGTNVVAAQDLSGDATISINGVVSLKNTGTAGTYTSVTTDAEGRITGGSNPVVVGSIGVSAPIQNTGTSSIPSLSMDAATGSNDGYITAGDWTTFNSKQPPIDAVTVINTGSIATNIMDGVRIGPWGLSAGQLGEVRFYELVGNGSNYISYKSPDNLANNKIYTLPGAHGTNGQVLTTNSTGGLSWTSLPVTNVQTAVLSSYTAGTNAVIAATDSVVTAFANLQKQISDFAVSAIGGDFSGNLPNPTIAKLQGTTVTTSSLNNKDVLKYNATAWVNAPISATDLSSTGTASSAAYLAGDNTWKNFNSNVLGSTVTSVSSSGVTKANSGLLASDSVATAFNKLLFTQNDYISTSANQTISGSLAINSALGFITVNAPSASDDAANKGYVDSFGQWALDVSNTISYMAGNVGIGTTTPGSTMDVNGIVRATQICDRAGSNCKTTADGWASTVPVVTALTDATNVSVDASTGDVFTLTLTGNRTISNPTNLVAGKFYTFRILQDATGGRTLSWGTNIKFQQSIVASPAANMMSVFLFSSDGVNLYHVGSYANIVPSIYPFTNFTFTNCGQTGRTGPTLTACVSSYSSASWTSNTSYLNMTTNGIQIWTVPRTANYEITVAGAAGAGNATNTNATSAGGNGAVMKGTFALTAGEKLTILVGQMGRSFTDPHGNENGGGGGSFVIRGASGSNALIIAGGGGGAASASYGGSCTRTYSTAHGVSGNSTLGVSCYSTANGASGGSGGSTAGAYMGGAGGGLNSSGASGGTHCTQAFGGDAYVSGGVGGKGNTCYGSTTGDDNAGGFGGGGGGQLSGPGAGGGYSGGSTAGYWSGYSTYGTGGASYNTGTSQSNTDGSNPGHGYVNIKVL